MTTLTSFPTESLLETRYDLLKFLETADIDIERFENICHGVAGDFYDPEKPMRLTGGVVSGDEKIKVIEDLKMEPYLCWSPIALTGCFMQYRGVVDAVNNGMHVIHILEAIKLIEH